MYRKINISVLNIPQNLILVNPKKFIPKKNVLLSSELFYKFLNNDKINLGENLFLQSSCFGCLISGRFLDSTISNTTNYSFLSKKLDIPNKTVTSFWETEYFKKLKFEIE